MAIEINLGVNSTKEEQIKRTVTQINQSLLSGRNVLETVLRRITQMILENPYGLTKEEVRAAIPYIEALDDLALEIASLLAKVTVKSNPVENSTE